MADRRSSLTNRVFPISEIVRTAAEIVRTAAEIVRSAAYSIHKLNYRSYSTSKMGKAGQRLGSYNLEMRESTYNTKSRAGLSTQAR